MVWVIGRVLTCEQALHVQFVVFLKLNITYIVVADLTVRRFRYEGHVIKVCAREPVPSSHSRDREIQLIIFRSSESHNSQSN